ncbi:MAG: hypothetical protein JXA98_05860 [Methanosarcinaceae archaeon]|nr:hypothetical protein [Methanosarcinaceae archaeon]
MDKRILVLCAAFLISFTTTNACAYEILPPNIGEFADDYYDVSGEPRLSAFVIGDPELESGETSTLFIRLANDGYIEGFENEDMPSTSNERMDARIELHLESDVTTAINIQGTLENNNGAPVTVISGLKQFGFLRDGGTSMPVDFEIEFFRNAPSGTYELSLNLTYQFQYDAKVEGYPDEGYDYWYVTRNQSLPILITVKPKAEFEIMDVSSELVPDEKGILYITYRNVGSDVAEGSVARIMVDDPFTTNDDEAFMGTLYPGDSYKAQYTIKVDKNAWNKTYGIDTEVEYRDMHGNTRITDTMTAPATVSEPLSLLEKVGLFHYLAAITCMAGVAVVFGTMKKGGKNAE